MVSPSHGGPVSAQVLEVCVNHCGEKFHNEVAKFRFLNELIKVLSPKVSTLGLALLTVLHAPRVSNSCHPSWSRGRPAHG